MTLLPLPKHWSQHILYMSGKQDKLIYSIPPQGKRRKAIKISLTFSESDKDRDEELDRQILRIVFGR